VLLVFQQMACGPQSRIYLPAPIKEVDFCW